MCGIAALVSRFDGVRPANETLFRMLDGMRHRGPDGQGVFCGANVQLGMVRLAIVDLENGRQPFWNEDRTLALVCNGEIYNAKELRASLEAEGHIFATRSDCEVILHLYEKEREKCLDRMEGIFAFLIWDERTQSLFAARDRMGVKPLYFAETDDYMAFASELHVLASLLQVKADGDWMALDQYHSYRFTTNGRTFYTGIHKLPPAHYLYTERGEMRTSTYWTPLFKTGKAVDTSADHLAAGLYALFVDSIGRQHAKEVKSAVLLSGGLDSSALLAVRTNAKEKSDLAITVGFERPFHTVARTEYSEVEEASVIARLYGAEHLVGVFSARDALHAFPHIVAALDEPIADPTAIPLWFAARMAHDADCKVVYSGEGLDELFAGYAVHRHDRLLRQIRRIPPSLRSVLGSWLGAVGLPGAGLMRRSLTSVEGWYQGVGGAFTPAERARLLDSTRVHSTLSWEQETSGSDLQKMLLFDILRWLPDNTLAKSDKVTMAHSVELRVPYLDSRIVELALACPDHFKRSGRGKAVVRQALNHVLPAHVLKRRKAGFTVPISSWMYGEWNEYAKEMLLSSSAATRHLYGNRVQMLFHAPHVHRERSGRLLYTALTLEVWLRQAHARVPD